jgi:hypothetical protein
MVVLVAGVMYLNPFRDSLVVSANARSRSRPN